MDRKIPNYHLYNLILYILQPRIVVQISCPMVDLKSMILVVQVKLNLVTDFVTIMTMMIMIKKVLYF